MSFFKLGKTALCDVCGATIRLRGSIPTAASSVRDLVMVADAPPRAELARHVQSESHVRASELQAYRHRDDSAHSLDGPLGCFICSELRRDQRHAATGESL